MGHYEEFYAGQKAKIEDIDISKQFKKSIFVTFEIEGFHRWQDAPEKVAFLRNWHRHIFKYKCEIGVRHDDRELEFFLVLDDLKTKVIPYMEGNENRVSSCEQKAAFILEGLINLYGKYRGYAVTCSEDGENGAKVTWGERL